MRSIVQIWESSREGKALELSLGILRRFEADGQEATPEQLRELDQLRREYVRSSMDKRTLCARVYGILAPSGGDQ